MLRPLKRLSKAQRGQMCCLEVSRARPELHSLVLVTWGPAVMLTPAFRVRGSYTGEEREMTSAGTCCHPFCQAQEMRKGWDKVRVEYNFS